MTPPFVDSISKVLAIHIRKNTIGLQWLRAGTCRGPCANWQSYMHACTAFSTLVTQTFRKFALSVSDQHFHQTGRLLPPLESILSETPFSEANVYALMHTHLHTCSLGSAAK